MSDLSAFQPFGPCTLVDNTARQVLPSSTSVSPKAYRVRNLSASAQYFTYGNSNGVTSVGAPTGGVPSANTFGMAGNGVETFIIPVGFNWFIASTSTGFEFIPGEGV